MSSSPDNVSPAQVKQMRRGRKRPSNSSRLPPRRRSRVKSGDSLSAGLSGDEAGGGSGGGGPAGGGSGGGVGGVEAHQEFRFPKHKKHMVAEYLGNVDR